VHAQAGPLPDWAIVGRVAERERERVTEPMKERYEWCNISLRKTISATLWTVLELYMSPHLTLGITEMLT